VPIFGKIFSSFQEKQIFCLKETVTAILLKVSLSTLLHRLNGPRTPRGFIISSGFLYEGTIITQWAVRIRNNFNIFLAAISYTR